nr:GDNF-inducible zinc finger protein 1-like [Penaeus vannamei]
MMNEFKLQLKGLIATLEKLPSSQQREAIDILQLTINHQFHGTQANEDASATSSADFSIPRDIHSQQSLSLGREKLQGSQDVIGLKAPNVHQQNISEGRLHGVHQQNVIESEEILSESEQSSLKKVILPLPHQQNSVKDHSHELHSQSLEVILPQDLNVPRTPDHSLISLEPFPQAHTSDLGTVHSSLHHSVDTHTVQCLQQSSGVLSQQTENLTEELETFDRAQQAAAKRNRLQEVVEIVSQEIATYRSQEKLGNETQDSSELESLLHQHEELGREMLQEQDNTQDFPGNQNVNSPENQFHASHLRNENVKATDTVTQDDIVTEKDTIPSSSFITENEGGSMFSEQESYAFNFKLESERNSCTDLQYSSCSLPRKHVEEITSGSYFSSQEVDKEGHVVSQEQELVSLDHVENVVDPEKNKIAINEQEEPNTTIASGTEGEKGDEKDSASPPVERRSLRKRKCRKKYCTDTVKEKKSKRSGIDSTVQKRDQVHSSKRLPESALEKENKENQYEKTAHKNTKGKEPVSLNPSSSSEVLSSANISQETQNEISCEQTKESAVDQSQTQNTADKQAKSLQSDSSTTTLTELRNECDGSWPPTLRPVSCRSCKKELPDESLFSVHLRQCEGHLVCNYCHARFVHKVTFSRHIEGHKRNVCSKCPQSFCSHKKLKHHMKVEHNFDLVTKTYPCQFCTRIFLKRFSLYYHLKIHASESEIVCQKCGVFCQGNENFKAHMAEHVKATDFHCHICTASFRRRQQYNDHLKLHKKYTCELCGQPLTTKRALVRHCRQEHKTLPRNIKAEQEYKCDKCDRVFQRPSILQNHLQLHKGVKPLECKLCNKKFSHQRGLRKHMTGVIHEHMLLTNNLQKDHAYDVKQNLAFTCEYCGIKLPSRNMLLKHSRVAHKVGITWTCPHCDYKTKRNYALKRHMELHLESRNFMCEVCGSSFHALGTLKDHYKFMHSDERNFKCTECSKTFKNKSSLARHHHTHSDNRPYQCHCGTSYKRLSHLKRHMLSAHDETLKSRLTKKFRRVEDMEASKGKLTEGQETAPSTEFSEGEDFEFVDVSNSSLSPVIQTVQTTVKDTSDILLPAQESIILMGENSNSEQSQLITVGDSQIIQLIPSTFQFPQESTFQTVSLVSASELHTLPLSSAAPYGHVGHSSQVVVEPFNLSQNSETMVMVPTSPDNDPLESTLRTLENEGLVDTTQTVRPVEKHDAKDISLHSLTNPGELTMTSNLHTFDYTETPSSQSLLPTLPPAHYITHSHASNSQIGQELLQQNLICSEFVLPVDNDR